MNPIGHMLDGNFAWRPPRKQWQEDASAHLPMQATHSIDYATASHSQICHVECFSIVTGILASEREQFGQGDVKVVDHIGSEILLHQLREEAIETCGHGRMRGEDVAGARHCQRGREWLPAMLHE